MILNEVMIKHYCKQHGLIRNPIIPGERSEIGISSGLSNCGYDIRLGPDLKKFENGLITPFGEYAVGNGEDRKWEQLKPHLGVDDSLLYCIYPGDLILGSSIEYIKMPKNLFGIAHLKSCWARTGLTMSLGALQPGWDQLADVGIPRSHLSLASSHPVGPDQV